MIYFVLTGLAVLCFASIGARSFHTFSRHILDDICRRRGAGGVGECRRDQILKTYERAAVSAEMFRLLLTVAVLFAVFFHLVSGCPVTVTQAADSTMPLLDSWHHWAGPLASVIFALLISECWLARTISKLWGTHFVYYTWPLWQGLSALLYPLRLLDDFINILFHRLAGKTEDADEEEAFEEEIRTIVTEGHREGLLEEEAREMIEGVMELGDFAVSEIMTPRTDMVCLSSELDWEEMLQTVMSAHHSRLPVYKENRDDIVGVLHAKDLLREMVLPPAERRPWTDLAKEPLFIPETKAVDTLLREFQNTNGKQATDGDEDIKRAKGHLAIVLDEYGGVSGIVTLEDILEEIVGDISDEHDPQVVSEEIRELGPNSYEALGKVRIDDLNEALHIFLPEDEDYDTVAGFIFSTLGHVPQIGETVDYEHDTQRVRFTVLDATRRRIEKVRIEPNPLEQEP